MVTRAVIHVNRDFGLGYTQSMTLSICLDHVSSIFKQKCYKCKKSFTEFHTVLSFYVSGNNVQERIFRACPHCQRLFEESVTDLIKEMPSQMSGKDPCECIDQLISKFIK